MKRTLIILAVMSIIGISAHAEGVERVFLPAVHSELLTAVTDPIAVVMELQQDLLAIAVNNHPSGYFKSSDYMVVLKKLREMSDDQLQYFASTNYKDPNAATILSLFLGVLGIDRFYLGQPGLGVVKLLTFGGLGWWWIIDWFLVGYTAKEKNFSTFLEMEVKSDMLSD